MMKDAAKVIVSLFERQGAIRPDEREVYIYGCDIVLYTLISTLGLLVLGTAFGRLLEAVLCVGIFYINQSFGGGYHADTHMRCFVTMAAGLLIYILSLSLLLPPMVYWVCGFLATAFLSGKRTMQAMKATIIHPHLTFLARCPYTI